MRVLTGAPVLGRAQLRLRNARARIAPDVRFHGDARRARLARGVTVLGPTVISVENGGGLVGAELVVGERTFIGEFNNIRCAGAPITIGADCLISQQITIVGSNHRTEPGRTIGSQPWEGDGVRIGDDVWVGAGSVLLPGAKVGDGAVVAAGSVVRGAVPPHSIVGGVPARVIGTRGPGDGRPSRGERP